MRHGATMATTITGPKGSIAASRLEFLQDPGVEVVGGERFCDDRGARFRAEAGSIQAGAVGVLEHVGVAEFGEIVEREAAAIEREVLLDNARDVLAAGEVAEVAHVVMRDELFGRGIEDAGDVLEGDDKGLDFASPAEPEEVAKVGFDGGDAVEALVDEGRRDGVVGERMSALFDGAIDVEVLRDQVGVAGGLEVAPEERGHEWRVLGIAMGEAGGPSEFFAKARFGGRSGQFHTSRRSSLAQLWAPHKDFGAQRSPRSSNVETFQSSQLRTTLVAEWQGMEGLRDVWRGGEKVTTI